MRLRGVILIGAILLTATCGFVTERLGHLSARFAGKASVESRLQEYGERVDARVAPAFTSRHLPYPPPALVFLAFKDAKRLEVRAPDSNGVFRQVLDYKIRALSGGPGPKLREGDGQVPEGIYEIESLNPNSRYHLALRLNYPNGYDRLKAKEEGRHNLGSDIMIHGSDASIGCLAMGDRTAEDLFVLAARTDPSNIRVIIAPQDFRGGTSFQPPADAPPWTSELYAKLQDELKKYR